MSLRRTTLYLNEFSTCLLVPGKYPNLFGVLPLLARPQEDVGLTREPARRKLNRYSDTAYVPNVWGVGYRLVATAG